MEHTENILDPNKGIIPLLLKLFSMFLLRLFGDKEDEEEKVVELISIMCINCTKETVLYL